MTATVGERFRFTVAGPVVPAVRMTQASKHVNRQAQRYLAFREAVGRAAQQHGAALMDGPLEVRMWFYLSRRRGRDWDNLAKAVCDGMNQVVYRDDSLVNRALVTVREGYDEEHVDVEVIRL